MPNSNPYLDLLQQDTENELRQSMMSAVDKQPDDEANIRKLATDYNLPVDAVRLDRPTVERKAKLDAIDYQTLAREQPATAAVFKNPDNAALMFDDIDNLSGLESALKFGKGLGMSAVAGVAGFGEGMAGGLEFGADALARITGPIADFLGTPDVLGRPLAQDMRDLRQNQGALRQFFTPKADGNVESGVYSGVQSLTQNLLTLPLAVASGNPGLMLNTLTAVTGGQSYGKARDKGLSPEQATLYAGADAAVEYGTELLPVGALFKDMKAGSSVFKTLASQLATEIPGEQVATAFQDLNEWAVLNPERTFTDYINDRPDAFIQTLVATAVGTGGVVGTMKGVETLVNGQLSKAQQATTRAEQLQQVQQLAAASKVLQRDPSLVKAVADAALADGDVQNVFIDANTLAQSGIAEQLAAVVPDVARQLPDALASGGEVKISMSDFVTAVSPASFAQSILPHVRMEGEDFSQAQAQAYMENHAGELQAELENSLAKQDRVQQYQTSLAVVKDTIKQQLDSVGHQRGTVNDHHATLLAHYYATQAEKLGMSAESLWEKYPVNVQSMLGVGRVFGQKPAMTSTVEFGEFATGKPVTFDFSHNTESATALFGKPKKGDRFKRDMEPSGRYVIQIPDASVASNESGRVSGKLTFNNPLVLNVETWKDDLFNHYKKRGKALSKALIADGFDGVVTIDGKYGTSEILDLTTFDESKALYQSAFDQPLTTQTPLPEGQTTITVDGVERSTLNSNNQAIHPTVEGVENFWRWFGDSKVVDESGRPLVVYHGTDAVFDTFKKELQKSGQYGGEGFFFTERSDIADNFGDVVMPLYLKAEIGIPEKRQAKKQGESVSVDHIQAKDDDRKIWVVFEPNQIKSATDNTGEFNPNNPNILYQFAGENAATANQFTLETAQQRLASGEDAETIRQETGWFKGVDDKWRFEISDQDASINMQGLSWGESTDLERGNSTVARLGKFLDHPALFSAYPDIADYMVRIVPGKSGASFSPDDQSITVGYDQKENTINLSSLLHEIQHGIQTIEGFASGGNPEQFADEFTKNRARLNFLENDPDVRRISDLYDKTVNQILDDTDDFNEALLKIEDYEQELIRNYEGFAELQSVLKKIRGKDATGYTDYKRLAGETEARNTQTRASMTDAERLATSPESTQDVKNSDVIVLFNGTEMHNAPMPANTMNQTQRGAFDPDTRTITLLENADLSTFLHESGHLFLELQMDLVTNLLQEDELVGTNPMQKQLIKDTQTLLEWFGLGSIQEWYALDFEQKRAYHEQFAESFEKYLLEGNAPSIELARVFASFRQWLKQVYQSMMTYFDNNQLNDDVRGVFDRMLATDEQIALAQQGRSMLPLFADQAKSGMSETEFAEYQAAWAGSTTEAQEQLALKGVRDMQWLQNARNKTLKKLQATHETLRRDMRNEVRAEVWSQPIYQVWQFLTSRISDDDKISEQKAARSNPNSVDPTQDTLFTAIAKLGGLDKQEMIDRWNWDQVGRAPMPVFGKPLVRKENGLSIEAMAEKLLDEGYLSADADGRYDTRQFEELFDAELRGKPQYSDRFDSTVLLTDQKAGSHVANILGLTAARLDSTALYNMEDLPDSAIQKVTELKMTARTGLHPDIVADLFGFSSGDEMVWELSQATPPKELIEQLTDQRMLQEHGELSTPEAIQRETDRALSNEARARFVTTEANMLSKMTGSVRLLTAAAKEMANNMIARVKVRDLSPSLYSRAEARAAKAAQQAEKAGDMPTAAAEKRNQLINLQANKAAHQAQEDISKGLRYLKKFDGGGLPTVSADYNDQIIAILDRYDFRKLSDAERNRREKSLQEWLTDQENKGLTPNIAPELLREHQRIPYKDLTVEELRGIIDAVKQIEHMGREQHKLWVLSKKRNFQEMETEVTESIIENAGSRTANARSAQDGFGKFKETLGGYFYSHIRAGSIARVLDGGKDGGKMWDYFMRPANERGEWETTQRAEYTRKLSDILTPLLSGDKLGGKGRFYPTINRSLNKTQVFAMALNMGNESNQQRLLGGEGWTLEQIMPVVKSLTGDDWLTVQKVWDLFEEFRPLIADKERRLYGKEPNWIQPKPFNVTATGADGVRYEVSLRGGYYPVKYDPRASLQAEQHEDAEDAKRMLKAAYAAATTRRSFTKNRVDAVLGRPLLLSIDGVFNGLNEVIHDLAWHEWLIDMNKVLGSVRIDSAIRTHYGPDFIRVLKQWEKDIAGGDSAMMRGAEKGAAWMRQNVSAAGLSFNLMSAAMQFTGITQSIVRVGGPWMAQGMMQMMAQPKVTMQFVNERSALMQNRGRTRFRELAELRNRIQYQSEAKASFDAAKFWLIVRAQGLVDYPTWMGAYFKAIEQHHDESKAIAMADQAVIDAQGGGETKDLSMIENDKNPFSRLFTLYYNFMGTLLNLSFVETQTEQNKAKLAAKMLLLFAVPTVMEHALRAALTPDDDDWDEVKWLTHGREILGESFDRMLGLFVFAREFKEPIKYAMGLSDQVRNYEGPTGMRLVGDATDLAVQSYQGEFDAAFRKAFINVMGDVTGLPSSQINKTWTGVEALADDKTDNPAALAFGFKK
jgi:hypothetical protein